MLKTVAGLGRRFAVHLGERARKLRLGLAEGDAILRPARSRQARFHRSEVKFKGVRVLRITHRVAEEALCLGVGLDQRHVLLVSASELEVVQGHPVDREDRDRRTILRRHIS